MSSIYSNNNRMADDYLCTKSQGQKVNIKFEIFCRQITAFVCHIIHVDLGGYFVFSNFLIINNYTSEGF